MGAKVEDLENEIKELIISTLNLEDMVRADIDSEAPLFGTGLGLDSIDALELGVAIKKKYKFTIPVEDKNTHQHFASVKSLANFISENI